MIPIGVEIPAEVGEPDEPPHVLFAGRLSEEKGILEFLEATEGLPRVIVGDGPLRDRVPEAVGFVPPSRARRRTTSARRSSASPSRREGYGMVAREAMAYGRPVVATRVGGLADLRRRRRRRSSSRATSTALRAAIARLLADPGRARPARRGRRGDRRRRVLRPGRGRRARRRLPRGARRLTSRDVLSGRCTPWRSSSGQSLAALVWTHVGYPLVAVGLARVAPRRLRDADDEPLPTVTVIIAAYNEETVIARRIENLLELDYPADRLQIVVSSDASSDRTEAIALEFPGVKVISNQRGGKVAAQDRAVRETESELVAFSDANATWAPDALRRLVRPFADPEVAYVCGQLRIVGGDGRNKEGVYWRYEMGVRAAESRLVSVTGGNGSIYALRRTDYVEVDPRYGHDLSLPYRMVQNGRRAVYAADAHAFESRDADERDRVPAQGAHVRALLADRPAREDAPPAAAGLRARARLAPPPPLRVGPAARRAARRVDRAHRKWSRVRRRARRAARPAARRGRRGRDRALLRARHLGDARLALELPAPRRARDVGGGGGHALNRALDVAIAGTGLAVARPSWRSPRSR